MQQAVDALARAEDRLTNAGHAERVATGATGPDVAQEGNPSRSSPASVSRVIGGQETWVNAIRCLIFDPEEGAPTHVALAKIDPIASTHLVKGQQASCILFHSVKYSISGSASSSSWFAFCGARASVPGGKAERCRRSSSTEPVKPCPGTSPPQRPVAV